MTYGQGINSKLIGAGFAAALLAANLGMAEPTHGIAMYGDPALPHDFVSLPYANQNAPKGEPSFPRKEAPSPLSIRTSAKALCLGSFGSWPMKA